MNGVKGSTVAKDGVIEGPIGVKDQGQWRPCIPSKAGDFGCVRGLGIARVHIDSENFMALGQEGVPRTIDGRVEGESLGW